MAQLGKHGLDRRHGFALARQHPGASATLVSHAAHTFEGVRIFGSESVVVTDRAGNILSETIADRRSGLGQSGLDVRPALDPGTAIGKVLALAAPDALPVSPATAELIIYPLMHTVRAASAAGKAEAELDALDQEQVVARYLLAYLVHTRMTSGNKPLYLDSVVSATDGSVLSQWNMLQTSPAKR